MKTVNVQKRHFTLVGKALFMYLFIFFISDGIIEAQTISQTIQETAHFKNTANTGNILSVYNIRGKVIIEGYEGDEIRISANKWVEAGDNEKAQIGIDELQLVVEQMDNEVLIYVDAPFVALKRKNGSISYNVNRFSSKDDYEFSIAITIQVPEQTNIKSSTITGGEVIIKNVNTESIVASNINGDVILERVSGKTIATTVNGNIRANYNISPNQNSEYKTVNGSIEVEYPVDLSADIHFKSLRGDLYSNFENIELLKSRTETNRGRNGTRWQINKFSPIRIGNGGPELQFNVVNGDVYLKQIKS